MSEHIRMLGEPHRNFYDSRGYLHPGLPFLRGKHRHAHRARSAGAGAGGRSGREDESAPLRRYQRGPRRFARWGASIFAGTIAAIRARLPFCSVEVLIPDFQGDEEALRTVMEAKPDILNHNIETVERLSDRVRAKAKYRRSLELLQRAKTMKPDIPTKSSIMLGVGEEWEEILQAMDDLRAVDCDILTIGQYLQPTPQHLRVEKYYTPEQFAALKEEGMKRGFSHVESGPLVRSSYHAHEQVKSAKSRKEEGVSTSS